jgi:acetyl esterase/lipase
MTFFPPKYMLIYRNSFDCILIYFIKENNFMRAPSFTAKAINFALNITAYKEKLDLNWWLDKKGLHSVPEYIKTDYHLNSRTLEDSIVFELTTKNQTPSEHVILYLYGSGFSKSMQGFHWKFLAELATKTGHKIVIPQYPLVPENNVIDVFNLLFALYSELTSIYGSERIILMGDSSGAGIAHSLTQQLHQQKAAPPSQLILLSPWLDITLSNPLIEEIEDRDPVLQSAPLKELGEMYRGEFEANNFIVSPVYGNIRRVAPTTVYVGTNDIMLADSRKLKLKAESEPVVFNYREFKGMFHNWMFFDFTDARKTRAMIFNEINYQSSEVERAMNEQNDFWKI